MLGWQQFLEKGTAFEVSQYNSVFSSTAGMAFGSFCLLLLLYYESGEVLAQAAQRGCGCPVPEGVQGRVGWSPGDPDLVLDLVAGSLGCGTGVGS